MQIFTSVPAPPLLEVKALFMVATGLCGKGLYHSGTAKSVFGLHSIVLCLLAIFWILVIVLNVLSGINFTSGTYIWVPTYVSREISVCCRNFHIQLYFEKFVGQLLYFTPRLQNR